jgi:hypothetical protein
VQKPNRLGECKQGADECVEVVLCSGTVIQAAKPVLNALDEQASKQRE